MEIPAVLWVLLVIFILYWILLPFAIWGVQSRLKRIHNELIQTNNLINDNGVYLKRLSEEAEQTLGGIKGD